jgi:outer membrane protein TolC
MFNSTILATFAALIVMPRVVHTQQFSTADSLASLLREAESTNPAIKASADLVTAARAKARAAGARPDPMLMLGAVNVPIRSLSQTEDDMTMRMIGIEQSIPYPGKLGLRRRIAELEVKIASASADTVRLGVLRDLKTAWYELSYIDAALAIEKRNETLLASVSNVSRARYASGSGTQQEVLRSTAELTRLNEEANELIESRLAAVARINELVDRPTESSLPHAALPKTILAAAIDSGATTRFVSRELGARVASSPLPSLAELQTIALEMNPDLKARGAMVEASQAEAGLSAKEYLPDINVSIQYGQRSGSMMNEEGMRTPRSDMISAVVSIPIPLQRRTKQNANVTAARATAASATLDLKAAQNKLRADVARLYSDISHQRTLIALLVNAVIPQSRASVDATVADYQAGRGDLTSVLTTQSSLFELEKQYQRGLTDFAQKIAELEAMIGKELLP